MACSPWRTKGALTSQARSSPCAQLPCLTWPWGAACTCTCRSRPPGQPPSTGQPPLAARWVGGWSPCGTPALPWAQEAALAMHGQGVQPGLAGRRTTHSAHTLTGAVWHAFCAGHGDWRSYPQRRSDSERRDHPGRHGECMHMHTRISGHVCRLLLRWPTLLRVSLLSPAPQPSCHTRVLSGLRGWCRHLQEHGRRPLGVGGSGL